MSALTILGLAFFACGGDGGDEYEVTGKVIDFSTGAAMTTTVTITVENIDPQPVITVDGANFTISEIPESTTFVVVIGDSNGHQTRHDVTVNTADVTLDPVHVPKAFLDQAAQAFGVLAAGNQGIAIFRAVDNQGNPIAGIDESEFKLPDGFVGTIHFLNDQGVPDAELTATSDSGLFIVFNIPAGTFVITPVNDDTCKYVITMDQLTAVAGVVSVADITVQVPPENVSFVNDVIPVFTPCAQACHSAANNRGEMNLQTQGGIYNELTGETPDKEDEAYTRRATKRDNVAGDALILRKPLGQLNHGGNDIFTGQDDPNYCILYTWIEEGAISDEPD